MSASSSSPEIGPADRLYLSPAAEEARTGLPIALRHQINVALRAIRDNPDWIEGRHLAPAGSRHAGCIVDLNVVGIAIVYWVRARESEVEVIDIDAIFTG